VHSFWSGKHSGAVQASGDPEVFWNDYTRNELLAAGVQDDSPALVQAFRPSRSTNVTTPSRVLIPKRHSLERHQGQGLHAWVWCPNRAEELTPIAETLGLRRSFPFYPLRRASQFVQAGHTHLFCRRARWQTHYLRVSLCRRQLLRRWWWARTRQGLVPVLLDPNSVFPEAECVKVKCLGDLLSVISQSVTR